MQSLNYCQMMTLQIQNQSRTNRSVLNTHTPPSHTHTHLHQHHHRQTLLQRIHKANPILIYIHNFITEGYTCKHGNRGGHRISKSHNTKINKDVQYSVLHILTDFSYTCPLSIITVSHYIINLTLFSYFLFQCISFLIPVFMWL